MEEREMKKWIDTASYEDLLARWRFEPSCSPWFRGEIGSYYSAVMIQRGIEVGPEERVRASKAIGFSLPRNEKD